MIASRILRSWQTFWFEPVAATNLGVARALFFISLAIYYLPHDFSGWGGVSAALYQPIWFLKWFGIPILGESALNILQVIWKLSLLCAAVGFFTRTSIVLAAILGTYLLGLGHNFGQLYHFDAILVIAFWILAFSRAGDAWSVDALIRVARDPATVRPASSGEYQWPVQLILVAFSLVFCAAGIAKLRASGVQWVLSDHLAILLNRVQYRISDADPLVTWGSAFAGVPWISRLLAFGTIFFETLYPIALFSRRLRVPLVLGGMGLVLGIRALMGPTFENFLLMNIFWVPWDRVGAWISARVAARTEIHVFYDGACGLCRPTVAILRRLDLLSRVAFVDVTQRWTSIAAQFPSLDRDRCLTDMHAVTRDGATFAGFDAYRALARFLPLGWMALPFLYIPPVAGLGRRVYRWVADHRERSCALPLPPPAGTPMTLGERADQVSDVR